MEAERAEMAAEMAAEMEAERADQIEDERLEAIALAAELEEEQRETEEEGAGKPREMVESFRNQTTTSPALAKMTTSAQIRQKAPARAGRSFKVRESSERFTNMTTIAQIKKKAPVQGGRSFKVVDSGNTENYTNFMSYELFSAQDNNVPQTTNIDNNVSPILGTNEYCTQGNTLQSGVPVGFDFKCQMNCSNV